MRLKRAGRPLVVLVGRPNVGKSTLFNRITGTRRSIVAPVAGTTRDVLEAPAEWRGRSLTVVDTGGLHGATTDPLHRSVAEQGLAGLGEADLVVVIVDGCEGLVPGDHEIVRTVRKLGAPAVLAINKADDKRTSRQAPEFARLGLDPMIEVSAEHGGGVAELLDVIVDRLPKAPRSTTSSEPPEGKSPDPEAPIETAVAIVGRPNVGKSSLVNRLANDARVLVSETPGTTRDAIDVLMRWRHGNIRLVDTAGMRRPGRAAASGAVESVSVVLARRAMARADVAILVVDATEGAGDRDGAIAGEALDAGCGVVIAVNKWDLVKGRGDKWVAAFDDKLRFQLKFLDFAPIVHLSARTGDRTGRLLEIVDAVARARRKRVTTSELNRFLERVTTAHPPTSKTRRDVRILYGAQVGEAPPAFVLFTNVATELHFSYERYLINALRETFGFEGTPIRLTVRRRGGQAPRRAGRGR
jgi:GTP-binding protein